MYGHGVWDTICIFNRWNPGCMGMGCGTPYAYSIGGTQHLHNYAYSIGGPQHVRAWGHHIQLVESSIYGLGVWDTICIFNRWTPSMYGHGDTICIFNRWTPACTGMGCGTPYAYSIGGTQHVRAWGVGHHMHIQ